MLETARPEGGERSGRGGLSSGLRPTAGRLRRANETKTRTTKVVGPHRDRWGPTTYCSVRTMAEDTRFEGYKDAVVAHGETAGTEVEIVERNPGPDRVRADPQAVIVERAYGILMLHRRLVRDYEHLPCSLSPRRRLSSTGVTVRQRGWCAAPSGVVDASRGCHQATRAMESLWLAQGAWQPTVASSEDGVRLDDTIIGARSREDGAASGLSLVFLPMPALANHCLGYPIQRILAVSPPPPVALRACGLSTSSRSGYAACTLHSWVVFGSIWAA